MDRTLKNKLRPHDLDPLLGFQPWQVHHHPGVQGLQLKLHFLVFQAVVTILPHSLGTRIEILKSLRIGFVFCMLQHLVPEKLSVEYSWTVATITYLAMFAGYLEMKSFLILSLLAMSSSSPPQPQNMFEKPLTS